jgi:hypothetical protein
MEQVREPGEVTASASTTLAERHSGPLRLLQVARLETELAVAGLLLIAAHVIDDNFLQPQPGMSPADHLTSGLVPPAVLVGAAIAYPRLRAGGRATLALVFGLLGMVIGATEPVWYGSRVGLAADDYTGIAAVAGGLVLAGVGAATLWRTRRRDDRLFLRYGRRILIAVGAGLALFFVIFPLSLSYVFTHVARSTTASGDLGAPYETVAFKASDGLMLKGWFVPSKNGAALIVYPGKKGTQEHTRMLVRHGYGVLVFDRRGEGESEGDPNALGWGFDRDLKGRCASCEGEPMSKPRASAALAYRLEARPSCRRLRKRRTSRRSSRTELDRVRSARTSSTCGSRNRPRSSSPPS